MKDRESDGNLDNRIFVGRMSWNVIERHLEDTFHRYRKITEYTGHPRGFGFITFIDRRGADDAIKHMHRRELGDRVISVNKAEPKAGGEDVDNLHKSGGYPSRGKRSYGGGGGAAEDECFKCGRHGHWARECPSTGGDRRRYRDPPSMRSRTGEFDGHRDRYGNRDFERGRDRYMDDRRDGGRHSYRDRFEGRDKYETRDLYPLERYGMPEHHYLEDVYGKRERSSDRDSRYARDGYGAMGPLRDEGKAYRSRPGPYDRPSRPGGRSSSHERW
ncbi:hypothetical protein N665_0357s0020 [Sinapis alba]|nr:hypothetical protein N665_0357s0020 [Sinapis alba]